MISLFIDTSLDDVTVAIVRDGVVLSKLTESTPNMHSVYATSYVKKALDQAKVDANFIDKIMVVNGPGSFTGVRIGVTIAKTYGYLIKKDVIPVSSLKALAISSNHAGYVLSLISAKRNNYYMGLYDKDNNNVISEQFTDGNNILSIINEYHPLVVGNDYSVIGTEKVSKVNLDILSIVKYYMNENGVNYHSLVPNYLKLPQVYEK